MPRIDSTAVRQVEYDGDSSTLYVLLTTGRAYQYYPVPAWLYEQFLAAPSKGRFFNLKVRGNKALKATPINEIPQLQQPQNTAPQSPLSFEEQLGGGF